MVRPALVAMALAGGAAAALSQTSADQAARELADRYQREHDEVIRMFREDANYEEADRPDALVFFNSKESLTYLVTKPGHPAHPGVVVRKIVPAGGSLFVESDGVGRGNQLALRIWIMELDEQTRQDAAASQPRRTP